MDDILMKCCWSLVLHTSMVKVYFVVLADFSLRRRRHRSLTPTKLRTRSDPNRKSSARLSRDNLYFWGGSDEFGWVRAAELNKTMTRNISAKLGKSFYFFLKPYPINSTCLATKAGKLSIDE